MKLYLMRHAAAEAASGPAFDASRKLTFRGRKEAERAGRMLRGLAAKLEVIATSPIQRAVETARIVAAQLDPAPTVEAVDALSSGATPFGILAAVRGFAGRGEVLVVGHNPDLPLFCTALLSGPGGTIHFEPSSIWGIEVEINEDRPKGKLLWVRHPEDMVE